MIELRPDASSLLQPSLNSGKLRTVNDPVESVRGADSCPEPFVCPLSRVRVGMACRVRQLCAAPEIAHRLRELGFCEDQQIRLLSQQSSVICQICNVRLGISAQLADAIWVEPIPATQVA